MDQVFSHINRNDKAPIVDVRVQPVEVGCPERESLRVSQEHLVLFRIPLGIQGTGRGKRILNVSEIVYITVSCFVLISRIKILALGYRCSLG